MKNCCWNASLKNMLAPGDVVAVGWKANWCPEKGLHSVKSHITSKTSKFGKTTSTVDVLHYLITFCLFTLLTLSLSYCCRNGPGLRAAMAAKSTRGVTSEMQQCEMLKTLAYGTNMSK